MRYGFIRVVVLLGSASLVAGPVTAAGRLHDAFDEVLAAHVDDGQVDYPAFRNDPHFAAYLQRLAATDPASLADRAEQLAFWINGYNALAIAGILQGLSPRTLFGRISFFKIHTYAIGSRAINLYDLERKVIIPFGEAKVHFALVCASQSCPKLRPGAYSATDLQRQLAQETAAFINDPDKNVFDAQGKRARISKIFDWYHEDFEQAAGSVQKFLARFTLDPAVTELLSKDGMRISFLRYDWSLNGTPP